LAGAADVEPAPDFSSGGGPVAADVSHEGSVCGDLDGLRAENARPVHAWVRVPIVLASSPCVGGVVEVNFLASVGRAGSLPCARCGWLIDAHEGHGNTAADDSGLQEALHVVHEGSTLAGERASRALGVVVDSAGGKGSLSLGEALSVVYGCSASGISGGDGGP
jgi:hypothetical protein